MMADIWAAQQHGIFLHLTKEGKEDNLSQIFFNFFFFLIIFVVTQPLKYKASSTRSVWLFVALPPQ